MEAQGPEKRQGGAWAWDPALLWGSPAPAAAPTRGLCVPKPTQALHHPHTTSPARGRLPNIGNNNQTFGSNPLSFLPGAAAMSYGRLMDVPLLTETKPRRQVQLPAAVPRSDPQESGPNAADPGLSERCSFPHSGRKESSPGRSVQRQSVGIKLLALSGGRSVLPRHQLSPPPCPFHGSDTSPGAPGALSSSSAEGDTKHGDPQPSCSPAPLHTPPKHHQR